MDNQSDVLDSLIEEKLQSLGKDLSPEEKIKFREDVVEQIKSFQQSDVGQGDAEEFTKFNMGLGLPGAKVLLKSILKAASYTDKRIKHILGNLKTPHDIREGTALEVTYQKNNKEKKIHMRIDAVQEDHNNIKAWEDIAQNVTTAELEQLRNNEGMMIQFTSSVMGYLVGLNKDLFDDLKKRLPDGVKIDKLHYHSDNNTMSYMNNGVPLEPRIGIILG